MQMNVAENDKIVPEKEFPEWSSHTQYGVGV